MNQTTKGILYALVTTLFWGFLAIVLKVAVLQISPFTIVCFRFTFAFLALFLWFLITDRKQLRILIRPPWQLVVASLALAINYIGFMLGIHYTSPSNTQVIIQVGPVLLALSGIVLFGEKLKKVQIVGFGIVLAGFALFYHQQLKSMFFHPEDFNTGLLLTLMAAVAWSVYAIMQKKMVKKYPPQTLNLFLYGLPMLLYLPLADFQNLATLSSGWWLLLVFLGANTLIAYGCISAALKYIEANKVSAIIINNPIITFLTMALLTRLNVSWIS